MTSGTGFVGTVEQDEAGLRLDLFLAGRTGWSRSRVQKLIADGHVIVNGKPASKSLSLTAGQKVEAAEPETVLSTIAPEEIPLDIKYEDEHIIVLVKAAGMVTHPAPGHGSGTLVNALMAHTGGLSVIGGEERPGIIHRLDKDTSGLMIIAKTDAAHRGLSTQMKNRQIKKTYKTLVRGGMPADSGTIDEPIGRHPSDRKKMSVAGKHNRDALTTWKVLERLRGYSLLEIGLATGRTHQIRVHLLSVGHPVAGDPLYGGGQKADHALGLRRQFLHASGLSFIHPVTGRDMIFEDALPQDLIAALEKARAARA
jgi:23S rRNA pseudouridine1911/1915/1917 synthase